MGKPKKAKQQTLEATLGVPRTRPPVKTPKRKTKQKAGTGESPVFSSQVGDGAAAVAAGISPWRPRPSSSATFMGSSQLGRAVKKRRVVFDDDDDSDDSDDGSGGGGPSWEKRGRDGDVTLPPGRETTSDSSSGGSESDGQEGSEDDDGDGNEDDEKGEEKSQGEDDEDDEDDSPLVTPASRNRLRRKRHLALDDSDENEQPQLSSPIKRRRLVRGNAASSPVKRGEGSEDGESPQRPPERKSSRAARRPRTKKEKARELLRRKRAGEIINEDDELSSSEEEAPAKGLYDSDSDHPALSEFEDDEEGVLELGSEEGRESKKDKKRKKEKQRRKGADDGEGEGESDGSTDDFIVDDSDAPLGIPDEVYSSIPLEFTAHSHKPLREHFRDAIEWLVSFKVFPGFPSKNDQIYRLAWKKLNDEVSGLAQSKFSSGAWTSEFTKALQARPYFTNRRLEKFDPLLSRKCGACGRSGHPATWVISFSGPAYYKDATRLDKFLDPVETNSDDDDSDSTGSESCDEDEDGNSIPKESRQWHIGAVCNSNAETAHDLIHWKHALLDWVDARLHQDGLMAPERLAERERMTPKQKYKLVDDIMDGWVRAGIVKALYRDFKGTIEQARNKPTSGRQRRGWGA